MAKHASKSVNHHNTETWVIKPDNLFQAYEFCELLLEKREQALGFELYGKDREQMIDIQASELACAASMNSEIDIEWMIYELAHDLRDYLYFLRDDELLEEQEAVGDAGSKTIGRGGSACCKGTRRGALGIGGG